MKIRLSDCMMRAVSWYKAYPSVERSETTIHARRQRDPQNRNLKSVLGLSIIYTTICTTNDRNNPDGSRLTVLWTDSPSGAECWQPAARKALESPITPSLLILPIPELHALNTTWYTPHEISEFAVQARWVKGLLTLPTI